MRRPLGSPFLVLPLIVAAAACEQKRAQVANRAGSPAGAAATADGTAGANEHVVFDLVDNRLLAHVVRGGGLLALPGSPGFAKYMRFGKPIPTKLPWKLHQRVDERPVAIASMYAPLDVPLTKAQAAGATEVHIRLRNPSARRMTLMVGGRPTTTIGVAAGWQTLKVPVPAGALRPGENFLQLAFGRGEDAAVEWIQVGGEPGPARAPVVYDPGRRALVLADGIALVYYVQVPAGGRLVGEVIGEGCRVTAAARAHGGGKAQGELAGARGAVDLAALAGRVVRLELAAAGCREARLARAGLAIPGPAPTVTKKARPRHVIFWVMGSLRADRVKLFDREARADVPVLEDLAASSTVFRAAYAQANESRASYASLWSSLYPFVHTVLRDGDKLDARWFTLGEAMKAARLQPIAVTANAAVTPRSGLGAGFETFRNHAHGSGGLRAEHVVADGVKALGRVLERGAFLHLGTVDTDVPWRAREPWFSRYDPRPYEGRFRNEASGRDVALIGLRRLAASARDLERIQAMYDSNVSYQDAALGELREALAKLGVADETLLVVTADHGVEPWAEGPAGRGQSLAESLIRVPLLIHYPPLFPAGVVDEEVETIDLLPTLLDALGMNPPEEAQGSSLLPLAQGVGRGTSRGAITSQAESSHAIRLGRWKARVSGTGVPAVFDLATDPMERRDLAAERPLERRFLTDVLSNFLIYQKYWRKTRWGQPANMSPQMADDLER